MTQTVYHLDLAEEQYNALIALLHQQATIHDELSIKLGQASALAFVSSAWDGFFIELSESLGNQYLSVLYDILHFVIEAHEGLHEAFLKMRGMMPAADYETFRSSD